MSGSQFWKPTTIQDFELMISASDMEDGRVSEEAFAWLNQVVKNYIHRFEPQVPAGKAILIHIRMGAEK